jgi:hypothetical protein
MPQPFMPQAMLEYASLISYYLWNESGLIASNTALIYYLIPVFSGILAYFFLKPSHCFDSNNKYGNYHYWFIVD